ncbi:MAG TPA: formate dehydrogenase subunit gamma [Anaeromyxobacteraceae bacterium]|nr:formate dehydrogenase subunit gamma [Anaeromyxobacteraceae bacterium]
MSDKAYPVEARPRYDQDPNLVLRYSQAARLAHWAVAVSYLLLFFSGLALFHPYFYWLSSLYGDGSFMRVLHPFLGVALAVLFCAYAARIWRDNLFLPGDRLWLEHSIEVMSKRAEVPVEGKYNAGQKLMFWSMLACILALLASGIVIWRPYFAPAFSASIRRAANAAHAGLAFVMFVGIGVHVYAAYWTKGSVRAMTRGYVTRSWARFHHPGWYRKVTGDVSTSPGKGNPA